MEETFTFNYEWMNSLTWQDFLDWEKVTNESWEDFIKYGGSPVYRDGKPVKDEHGNLVRRASMLTTMAFVWIMKRSDDPSWTYEDTKRLKFNDMPELYTALVKFLEGKSDDDDPKSESHENGKGTGPNKGRQGKKS